MPRLRGQKTALAERSAHKELSMAGKNEASQELVTLSNMA